MNGSEDVLKDLHRRSDEHRAPFFKKMRVMGLAESLGSAQITAQEILASDRGAKRAEAVDEFVD
jgi:hypothetical protein